MYSNGFTLAFIETNGLTNAELIHPAALLKAAHVMQILMCLINSNFKQFLNLLLKM